MTTYNPTAYWTERGKNYYKLQKEHTRAGRLQQKALTDYLKTIQFDSVLEIGCGYGRITQLIAEQFKPRTYHAIDLSQHQIAKARERIPCGVWFDVSTIQEFKAVRKYDLVLACEVLLHVTPVEIEAVMDKMVQLSNRHIVNIDPIHSELPLAEHNFIHAYQAIYRKQGLEPTFREIEGTGQHIIHTVVDLRGEDRVEQEIRDYL